VAELRDRIHAAALQAHAMRPGSEEAAQKLLTAQAFIERASKRLDPENLTDGAILWAEQDLADGLAYLSATN
jgi:hypothetical protein